MFLPFLTLHSFGPFRRSVRFPKETYWENYWSNNIHSYIMWFRRIEICSGSSYLRIFLELVSVYCSNYVGRLTKVYGPESFIKCVWTKVYKGGGGVVGSYFWDGRRWVYAVYGWRLQAFIPKMIFETVTGNIPVWMLNIESSSWYSWYLWWNSWQELHNGFWVNNTRQIWIDHVGVRTYFVRTSMTDK